MKLGENDTIETKIAIIKWEDKEAGILFAETKPSPKIGIDDLKEVFAIYKNYYQHPNRKLLLDLTYLSSALKAVRDYFAKEEGIYNYFEAIALYSSSKKSMGGIIAKLAMKVYHHRKPTRFFYDRKKAIDWLKNTKQSG